MKAAPLLVSWHNDNAPIYAAHFQPHSAKGRLATSGGDNNVRLWRLTAEGDDRKVTYLSTLIKHTQAVNVVRFAPKGDLLATAGDDGNTLLWVPSELHHSTATLGDEGLEDQETWRVKHMCRSFGSEIYDLAWSPDAAFFITGSMDNIARIYNAQNGQIVRQIAEHNHYVQGVAWDPLNEFVATQSSDRSVHIYSLRTKDGEFTLRQHNKVSRMDLPGRRISTSSPLPPEGLHKAIGGADSVGHLPASPAPSASIPGTPTSLALPMNPPIISHSRRSSFGSSPSARRSASPAPMPLPAVRPMEHSPVPFSVIGYKHVGVYANETFTSFFRRLAFAPDGSLLFTPAGQYRSAPISASEGTKPSEEIANTVYIYTRAGLNKPPVAHLPGHKKPSIAVKCSPIFYTLRTTPVKRAIQISLDTSSADEAITALPDSVLTASTPTSSSMEPPRPASADRHSFSSTTMPSPKDSGKTMASPRDSETSGSGSAPPPAFALPYRVVYAVATQDAVLVYDTQQQTPLCVVSNLHFATFTDLTWSNDGLTLIMSSSDGFCSSLSFAPGELGQVYTGPVPTAAHPHPSGLSQSSTSSHPHPALAAVSVHAANAGHSGSAMASPSPVPTPTTSASTPRPFPPGASTTPLSTVPPFASPAVSGLAGPHAASGHPNAVMASPIKSRSNSTSSVATQASHAPLASGFVGQSPTPTLGTVPSVMAAGSGMSGSVCAATPPMTPMSVAGATASASTAPTTSTEKGSSQPLAAPAVSSKRATVDGDDTLESNRGETAAGAEGSGESDERVVKKRRIAPTPVLSTDAPSGTRD